MKEGVRAIYCPSCGAPIRLPKSDSRLFTCQYCSSTLEDQTTPEERAAGAYPSLVIHESPEEAFPPIDSSKMGLSSQIKRSTRRIGIIVLLFALLAGAIGVLVALLIV